MNQNKTDRGTHILWIFLPTVFAVIIQSAVAIMAVEICVVKGLADYKLGSYTDFVIELEKSFTGGESVAMISVVYAILTAILMLFVFRSNYRDGKLNGFKPKVKNVPMMIVGMLLFVVSMQYVTVYLMNAVSSAFPSWLQEYQELMDSAGLSDNISLPMILYATLLGPVCEELIFRGVTFFAARKVMPIQFAILVQAILFGAFHMNKLQGIYAFVLGLGLGYIMYLYDNLLVTIIIHIGYNIIGVMEFPMAGETLITFFLCSLGALIAAYGSIIFLRNGSAVVNNDQFFADN